SGNVARVCLDPGGVLVEALALGPARRIRPDAFGKLLPKERVDVVAPLLIGLEVQVKADDGKRTCVESGDAIEGDGELIKLRHAGAVRKRHTETLIFSSAEALRR